MEDVRALLTRPQFPRSANYDPEWMLEHQMGPNALWLVEWLCERVPLSRGMRVLDLGCGKALTSIFLAREFGVHVHALDLWMGPDHNLRRAQEAGVGDLVCPLKGEAHALPFARGYFDAIVSIDAYQYFGTTTSTSTTSPASCAPEDGSAWWWWASRRRCRAGFHRRTSPSRDQMARGSGSPAAGASGRPTSGARSGRAARS